MTQILKQSTAVDVLIGPFVDITDGATAETGESPAVKLSKNGQTLGAKNDATTPVHDADGYHNCEFDATDTDTVGTLVATVAASATALPVRHEYQVVIGPIFDALYGASAAAFDANQRVDVGAINGDTAAAIVLALSAGQMIVGVVDTDIVAATTTSFEADDVGGTPEATAEHYKGRNIMFTSGVMAGQAAKITNYSKNGSNGVFTITQVTEVVANNVTFIIF